MIFLSSQTEPQVFPEITLDRDVPVSVFEVQRCGRHSWREEIPHLQHGYQFEVRAQYKLVEVHVSKLTLFLSESFLGTKKRGLERKEMTFSLQPLCQQIHSELLWKRNRDLKKLFVRRRLLSPLPQNSPWLPL